MEDASLCMDACGDRLALIAVGEMRLLSREGTSLKGDVRRDSSGVCRSVDAARADKADSKSTMYMGSIDGMVGVCIGI